MTDTGRSIVGRTTWFLRQLNKQMWVRATMFSVAAVITALFAAVAETFIPYDLNLTLAAGSVGNILNILAASMLAVTTFSLSIMVSAYSAAASSVTPRSTKLLLQDSVAQNTLATFVGSFLFSVVGIIGIAADVYGDKGRVVLFVATLVVLIIITGALLRWIEQLGRFGRVGDTILRVEQVAVDAAQQWARLPRLGAQAWAPIPSIASSVTCRKTGYIQHIDMSALQHIAEEKNLTIHVEVLAGAFAHAARAVARISPPPDDDCTRKIAECFSIGPDREYDQDPRFGLIVLSEIASRALSPAVNDPGTAIEVIGAGLRVMLEYAEGRAKAKPARFDRLHAHDLETADLFEDFFNPIARDGASLIEVQMRIQYALEALADNDAALFGSCARSHSRLALARAIGAMEIDHDIDRLSRRAEWNKEAPEK